MPTFIRAGYWDKAAKSFKGWLNLDDLITTIFTSALSSVVTSDDIDAIQGANSPSGINVFATIGDIPTALSQLSEDATHRIVTDAEKSVWNSKANPTVSNLDIVTTTYTLSTDNDYFTTTESSPVTITVPNHAVTWYSLGTVKTIEQGGVGQIHIVGAGGVTVNAFDSGVYSQGQYACLQLINKSTDVWTLVGGTSVVVATTTTTTTAVPTTTTTTTATPTTTTTTTTP